MTDTTKTDAAAIVAEEAEVARVNEDTAIRLAAAFDDSADVFKRAQILSRGVKRGATLAEVATLTTRHRVERAFPTLTAEAVDAMMDDEKRLRKLRLSVSKSSVQAYVGAWNTVVDAAITPNRETVAIAFRAKSTGGTADIVKSAVEAANEAERGEREETFVSTITEGLRTLTAVKKSKGRPNDGADEGDEAGVDGVGFSLEGALHTIEAIFAQEWSDEDRAILAARVLEVAGLAETVEA